MTVRDFLAGDGQEYGMVEIRGTDGLLLMILFKPNEVEWREMLTQRLLDERVELDAGSSDKKIVAILNVIGECD